LAVVLVLAVAALPATAAAIGTEFTYQGRLDRNDVPASTTCDFAFLLYDAAVGGSVVSITNALDVPIEDGLFTVTLDFGAVFNGSSRWLEIQVLCDGDAQPTLLTPRQRITSVPYAVRSGFAENGGSGSSQWISNGPDLTYSGGGVGFLGGSSPFAAGKGVFIEGGSSSYGLVFAFNYDTFTPLPLILNSPGGRVGVGTAAPAARLHVVTTTASENAIQAEASSGAAVRGTYTGVNGAYTAGVVGINNGLDGNAYGVQGISYWGCGIRGESTASNGVCGVSLNQFGYGGLFSNTATGGVALRAIGKAQVGTLEITGGSDLVEGFDTVDDKTSEPGTVVVIDAANAGKLRASHEPYDRKVAGVVSGAGGVQAGLRLGQEGVLDGKTPVAMTGRVYVKCSTENGAIQAGDLLTTSATRGRAMRATDDARANGAVIGKAMSTLESGNGLVLVLVNLQ
jgi:hypothetical protein